MKSYIPYPLLIVLGFLRLSHGQVSTVYVDFGASNHQTVSPTIHGHVWNNVSDQNPTGVSNLVSSTGQLTGISLGVTGTVQANPFGTTVPNVSTMGGLAVDSATRDWFYLQGDQTLTITMSNMPPDGVYRLALFASRDWAGTVGTDDEIRVTRFEVAGLTQDSKLLTTSAAGIGISPQPNANRSSMAVFDPLRANANGVLTITVKRSRGAFGYLGALRLERMNVVNSPPSAISVNASGSPRIGSVLTGRYTYWDAENDPESGTQFFWERSTTAGATGVRIVEPSTTARTYTPGDADLGRYIRMGVIPRSNLAQLPGTTSYSRWMGPIVSRETRTSFHIGSSFTLWPDIPRQIREMGLVTNNPLVTGVQLTSGQGLLYHWNNGVDGGVFHSGLPSRLELATGTWDIFVIQPFNSEWKPNSVTQMREYVQRFSSLVEPHNTQVYLYCAWPWYSETVGTQTDINAAFEQVRAAVSAQRNRPILIIPAGQALRACIQSCGTGVLARYTREDFYRNREDRTDNLHLNHLGSYISALTHYATIFKTSPVGLPAQALDAGFQNDNVVTFDPLVARRLQEIVWYVVSTYPNALSVDGSANLSYILPPVIPPAIVEPDPPFVRESIFPSDPQLLQHAFSNARDSMPKASLSTVPMSFTVEYTVNSVAESQGITYTPHWSYDLQRWTATQPTDTVIRRSNDKVTISWPYTSRWRYFRVEVVKP